MSHDRLSVRPRACLRQQVGLRLAHCAGVSADGVRPPRLLTSSGREQYARESAFRGVRTGHLNANPQPIADSQSSGPMRGSDHIGVDQAAIRCLLEPNSPRGHHPVLLVPRAVLAARR